MYSIIFFKDVISDLTRYYRAWFPLVNLQSCEVMGDFPYRHTMLYIYATKSDYHEYYWYYWYYNQIITETEGYMFFDSADDYYRYLDLL